MFRKCATALALALAATPAFAYIGPGAGISFIGSIFTWIAGILIALFAILFWPIRLMIRRLRGKKGKARGDEIGSETAPAADEPERSQ